MWGAGGWFVLFQVVKGNGMAGSSTCGKKKKQRAAWITVRGHESRAQRLATAWEKRTALKRDPCAAPLQVPGAMGWGPGTEDGKVRDE